jgi:hypothetical protein
MVGPIAFAGLVVLVALSAFLQSSTETRAATSGARPSHGAVVPHRQGMVPAPPAGSGLRTAHGRQKGSVTYRPRRPAFSRSAAAKLYDFYVARMPPLGWTLVAKSNPDRRGQWTLNWQRGGRVAVIYMYTMPNVSLTINECPPLQYC